MATIAPMLINMQPKAEHVKKDWGKIVDIASKSRYTHTGSSIQTLHEPQVVPIDVNRQRRVSVRPLR